MTRSALVVLFGALTVLSAEVALAQVPQLPDRFEPRPRREPDLTLGWPRQDCRINPDMDGDGEPALVCGGSDCDDRDARRYPGALEICDADGVDEDCDPTTVGDADPLRDQQELLFDERIELAADICRMDDVDLGAVRDTDH